MNIFSEIIASKGRDTALQGAGVSWSDFRGWKFPVISSVGIFQSLAPMPILSEITLSSLFPLIVLKMHTPSSQKALEVPCLRKTQRPVCPCAWWTIVTGCCLLSLWKVLDFISHKPFLSTVCHPLSAAMEHHLHCL